MNVLILLTFLFILLVVLICGEQGIYTILGIFGNLGLFLFLIYLFSKGYSVYLVSLVVFTKISLITLFFVNGWNIKTRTAGISVLLFMLLFSFLVYPLLMKLSIQGFSTEELEELSTLSLNVAVPFLQLNMSLVLFSLSGAVLDGSMAVTSATFELLEHHPQISQKELFQSSMNIVKGILSSTVNTLLFAFMGSSLALIIWYQDLNYSFTSLINSKSFVSELAVSILTGLGAIVILPVAAYLSSVLYVRFNKKEKSC